MSPMPRRTFIKSTAATTAGITIVPSHVMGRALGHKAPSDKLNIAGIGIGGKGRVNLEAMNSENIVALCDVDWKYARDCFNDYPDAKRYWDWRRIFDEMGDDIDGVMIATSDHTHAAIAATAITMGKHVYCQKPLTHSVYESRLLTRLAREYQVATQMGNQGNSAPEARTVEEWIWSGEIGKVKEVHAWTNRPVWPQGLQRPTEKMTPPETMNWDLFIGPAPMRPYHIIYTPWNWRGWWDFGTGALGDMACHILNPVFSALQLGYPNKVQGSSTLVNTESAPQAEVVEYTFPERKRLPSHVKVKMPEVKVFWYDGGMMPSRPEELADGEPIMEDGMGGCIFVGTKDKLICNLAGIHPRLLSGRQPNVPESQPRVPGYNTGGIMNGPHEQDWIRACKESPENRRQPHSNFDMAGPFNEMIVMGVLAVRLQSLDRELQWDGDNMRFTNISGGDELRVVSSDEFKVIDGHPHFNTKYVTLNAEETVQEYIKHNYRDGWSLPE
ncbi:MAG: Gfo/Idh/MocA family oxidoreductase [Bacteroidales bacterium]|nr:Gfo/Idh/MocA family oxidoreductase [Bacteroidales bacterium]